MHKLAAIEDYCVVLSRTPERLIDNSQWQVGPIIAKSEQEALTHGVICSPATWFSISLEGAKHGMSVDDLGQPMHNGKVGEFAISSVFGFEPHMVTALSAMADQRYKAGHSYVSSIRKLKAIISEVYEEFTSPHHFIASSAMFEVYDRLMLSDDEEARHNVYSIK